MNYKVHGYCRNYQLSTNIASTKSIIFSSDKERRFRSFKYGSDIIKIVNDYVYLDITMNYNTNFDKAMKNPAGSRSYSTLFFVGKSKKKLLPIDIQYNLL